MTVERALRERCAPSPTALAGAERLLWDACQRAGRNPKASHILVLHLSRLALRPYHRRIAHTLLEESAARYDGQVFTMHNRDLVLLYMPSGESPDEALVTGLPRLFSGCAPNLELLTSVWRLDRDMPAVHAYILQHSEAHVAQDMDMDLTAVMPSLVALQRILAKAPLGELAIQQTGLSLVAGRGGSLADRLAPTFLDLRLSLSPLNLPLLVSQATSDPFLRRYLAACLDDRILKLLSEDLSGGGTLVRRTADLPLTLHVELGMAAILSPAFARISRQASRVGLRFGINVSLMEACADLALLHQARRVLDLTGDEFVLCRVDPAALELTSLQAWQPDLVKLTWSSSVAGAVRHGSDSARLDTALAGFDPARIVLQNVDSERALSWGQARGISLFQGIFLDQVLAAVRMQHCPGAGGCTLQQCRQRAGVMAGPARLGCTNLSLLDASTGPAVRAEPTRRTPVLTE